MNQRIADMYEAYINGCLDRRAFFKNLARLAGGTAAACALLPQLEKNNAIAEG
ncbi:MAG: hypothetical protein ACYTGS_09195 [Planctomycetota bacterium]|jgi:hypothetical protein